MTLNTVTRVVYAFLGIFYAVVGAGAMVLPIGWLPQRVTDAFLAGAMPSSYLDHLLQEFGTIALALGMVFLLSAGRTEQNRGFHWAMTFYLSLDTLIHWVGPEGLIGSWQRGIINSIPFSVMLVLGLLQLRTPNPVQAPSAV
jgi:hypothetical protein